MVEASLRVFGDVPLRTAFSVRVAPTSITEWTTDEDPGAGGPPGWLIAHWTLERFNEARHLETIADDP
jgi:hypothetical protein